MVTNLDEIRHVSFQHNFPFRTNNTMRVFLPVIALLLSSAKAIDNKFSFLETFRILDEYYEYYYYYDGSSTEDDGSSTEDVVDSSKAAIVDGSCKCKEDTQILIDKLENSTALSDILVQITDTLLLINQTFIFDNDEELLYNFDSVCKGAGGMTVRAELKIAQCANFEHDYQGYPNCISKTCGGTELDFEITADVVQDMLLQGLRLELDESCTPEVSFRYWDNSPTFYCGQDVTGGGDDDGGDDGGDDDGGGALGNMVDTLLDSGQDEACVYDFIAMLQQPADLFRKAADLMVLKQSSSNSAVYHFNNNAAALSLYAEECSMYDGEIDLIALVAQGCFGIEDALMTHEDLRMCAPKSCEHAGVEIILKTVIEDGQSETCNIGVSVFEGGTNTTDTHTTDTTTMDTTTTDTSSATQKSFKIASKKAAKKKKMKKKKKGKSDEPADRSESLKCVADMTIIHGNKLGMNPYVSRTFVTNNMVNCTPSTDSYHICMYNGNATALAQFNIDCGGKNGRVIQTKWLFPDGCDGRDDGDFINRIGVHDCIATTCSDVEAISFFNTVYFDPADTSCYADVSIESMMPAKTKKKKKKKAKKSKARRNRAV